MTELCAHVYMCKCVYVYMSWIAEWNAFLWIMIRKFAILDIYFSETNYAPELAA